MPWVARKLDIERYTTCTQWIGHLSATLFVNGLKLDQRTRPFVFPPSCRGGGKRPHHRRVATRTAERRLYEGGGAGGLGEEQPKVSK